MQHNRFEEPVTVLVGMGLPARIETVMEAYALLQDWPAANRNSAHAVALNACKAGIAGEIDAETVRSTFLAFARRNDILVPDMDALIPAVSTASSSGANTRTKAIGWGRRRGQIGGPFANQKLFAIAGRLQIDGMGISR